MNQNIPKFYGLVLAGGESKRMGQDKAKLDFHGRPQVEHCCELLSKFCEKVFISCRQGQASHMGSKNFPTIFDAPPFAGAGPLAGILSAMQVHPNAVWLVLGCDLPFVTEETLATLRKGRDPTKIATAYRSTHDDLPEPLCAIYEPHGRGDILKFFKNGVHCPRKILLRGDAHLLTQTDPRWLENINSPEKYEMTQKILRNESAPKEN